ncbi:MAG: hypothetical protein WD078_00425 [Woeseia sp.]
MPKVVTGFLLGVIVTLAVIYWLDEPALENQAVSTGESLPPDEAGEVPQANPVKGSDGAGEKDNREPISARSTEADSNVEPLVFQPQPVARHPQDSGTSTSSPVPISSAGIADDQYPPEIAEMIENRVDKELQARYERDEREESWASYMEGQLARYFAQKPSLAQFNISLIDCRTSICSIHVLGYGTDALIQWNTATADLVSQPWFEFNNMSMNRRNPEPGILAVVLILTKKPPG